MRYMNIINNNNNNRVEKKPITMFFKDLYVKRNENNVNKLRSNHNFDAIPPILHK